MRVKVANSEIGRMMRILSGCIDQRDQKNSNVEISHDGNMFSIRAVNVNQFVKMSTPLLGGDGETFCVDGKMFANIIGRATGDVEIMTDGQNCVVKANGRTRIPLMNVKLANPAKVEGAVAKVDALGFICVADHVRYATATDETRPILTGVLVNIEDGTLTMAAVDGFQLAEDSTVCEGDSMNIVVPGIVVKRICECASPGESITITTDGNRVSFCTDTVEIYSGVMHGDFIDYKQILPKSFTTKVLFSVEELKDALKGSGVVGNAKNLVKLIVSDESITVTSNSEKADFEANVACEKIGADLTIAFNDKYVVNALNTLSGEKAELRLNTPVSPAIFTESDVENVRVGTHLVLPVRVM